MARSKKKFKEVVYEAESLSDADRVRLAVLKDKLLIGPLERVDCGHGKDLVYRWFWDADGGIEHGETDLVSNDCKICQPDDEPALNPGGCTHGHVELVKENAGEVCDRCAGLGHSKSHWDAACQDCGHLGKWCEHTDELAWANKTVPALATNPLYAPKPDESDSEFMKRCMRWMHKNAESRPRRRNAVCPKCKATDAYVSPFTNKIDCKCSRTACVECGSRDGLMAPCDDCGKIYCSDHACVIHTQCAGCRSPMTARTGLPCSSGCGEAYCFSCYGDPNEEVCRRCV